MDEDNKGTTFYFYVRKDLLGTAWELIYSKKYKNKRKKPNPSADERKEIVHRAIESSPIAKEAWYHETVVYVPEGYAGYSDQPISDFGGALGVTVVVGGYTTMHGQYTTGNTPEEQLKNPKLAKHINNFGWSEIYQDMVRTNLIQIEESDEGITKELVMFGVELEEDFEGEPLPKSDVTPEQGPEGLVSSQAAEGYGNYVCPDLVMMPLETYKEIKNCFSKDYVNQLVLELGGRTKADRELQQTFSSLAETAETDLHVAEFYRIGEELDKVTSIVSPSHMGVSMGLTLAGVETAGATFAIPLLMQTADWIYEGKAAEMEQWHKDIGENIKSSYFLLDKNRKELKEWGEELYGTKRENKRQSLEIDKDALMERDSSMECLMPVVIQMAWLRHLDIITRKISEEGGMLRPNKDWLSYVPELKENLQALFASLFAQPNTAVIAYDFMSEYYKNLWTPEEKRRNRVYGSRRLVPWTVVDAINKYVDQSHFQLAPSTDTLKYWSAVLRVTQSEVASAIGKIPVVAFKKESDTSPWVRLIKEVLGKAGLLSGKPLVGDLWLKEFKGVSLPGEGERGALLAGEHYAETKKEERIYAEEEATAIDRGELHPGVPFKSMIPLIPSFGSTFFAPSPKIEPLQYQSVPPDQLSPYGITEAEIPELFREPNLEQPSDIYLKILGFSGGGLTPEKTSLEQWGRADMASSTGKDLMLSSFSPPGISGMGRSSAGAGLGGGGYLIKAKVTLDDLRTLFEKTEEFLPAAERVPAAGARINSQFEQPRPQVVYQFGRGSIEIHTKEISKERLGNLFIDFLRSHSTGNKAG